MAMRESLRHIELVQNTTLTLQQQKEAERIKKQQEKENKQRLENEVKAFLRTEFERHIFVIGSCCTYEFYSIKRRKELFEDLKKLVLEKKTQKYANGEVVTYYNDKEVTMLKDYYNKYYDKILKEVDKQKQLDEQYEFLSDCEKFAEAESNKKELNNNTIIEVTKILLGIVFFPLLLVGTILIGITKNSK